MTACTACSLAQHPGPTGQFTGKERNTETGLDYFMARYFSSAQGRFTSPDPLLASARLTDPQTWNRYAYVKNDPVNMIDPDGQDSISVWQYYESLQMFGALPFVNGVSGSQNPFDSYYFGYMHDQEIFNYEQYLLYCVKHDPVMMEVIQQSFAAQNVQAPQSDSTKVTFQGDGLSTTVMVTTTLARPTLTITVTPGAIHIDNTDPYTLRQVLRDPGAVTAAAFEQYAKQYGSPIGIRFASAAMEIWIHGILWTVHMPHTDKADVGERKRDSNRLFWDFLTILTPEPKDQGNRPERK